MLAINYIRTVIAFVVAQVNTHVILLHCLNERTARVSRSEVLNMENRHFIIIIDVVNF